MLSEHVNNNSTDLLYAERTAVVAVFAIQTQSITDLHIVTANNQTSMFYGSKIN